MRDISPTPNIAVTIGGQLRVYYAYVTTAGPELDGPTTMTLYASTLTELSGFALDPIVHDRVARQGAGAARPDRLARTRLASRQISRGAVHLRTGGSDARQSPHTSALAVATPAGAHRQSGARMKRRIHSYGRVNRSPFRRAFQEVTL